MLSILSAYAVPVIFTVLFIIAVDFVRRFLLPAISLVRRLNTLKRQLPSGEAADAQQCNDLQHWQQLMDQAQLTRPWQEYRQSLHAAGASTNHPVAWCSSVRAEQFFNDVVLVEMPLKTEFYKHLPGILTGIGIIGTFAGLIVGLMQFEVSSDPLAVRQSLNVLIQGVGHAFQVSGLAIFLAMLFTWLEKSFTSRACQAVNSLSERLDTLFLGGTSSEEADLARLLRVNEITARELGLLRQQLAQQSGDQSERIAQAVAGAVSASVGQAVERALSAPLTRMSEAVERAGSSQGDAAARALNPILERFIVRMESQVGSGQDGLALLLKQTADSMNRVVNDMASIASRIESGGKQAVQGAASQLVHAGQGVGQAAETFAGASEQLSAAAMALTAAAREASGVMREQKAVRDGLALMLNELRGVINEARREASLSRDLVQRMEAAAGALSHAEGVARDYLEGVNRVLGDAHQSFADNIENTLRTANSQFHKELATAIDYLKGAIEDLGDTLSELRPR